MATAFTAPKKDNWPLVGGLIFLCLVPVLAGFVRLLQLKVGGPVLPENARFVAAPLPVVMHILCGTLYGVLGAFQFSSSFRSQYPKWHRLVGKVLIGLGLVVAFSGMWMTLTYPIVKVGGPDLPARFDGLGVYVTRLLVGSAMAGSIVLGYVAVLKRDIPGHRAWMMRAYALAMGAGTQVFTHIPWFVFPSIHGEFARAVCMAAGWAINLAVAEWFIVRVVRRAGPPPRLRNQRP
ncbi:MAG: hypothetical protein JWM80_2131 [Cyanobacteria bacterium RYN_339]|nr:hypothetical protein [Cyanobacteria bacterium RYN_339]